MILKFNNVEKIIFYDKKVQEFLPELTPIFQKWTLGIRTGIRAMVKDALLDFLNSVTPAQLSRIGSYLKTPVSVQTINSSLVKTSETDVKSLENELQKLNFQGNICLSRKSDSVYLCLWR